jgi:hypothetical protein
MTEEGIRLCHDNQTHENNAAEDAAAAGESDRAACIG